MEFSIRLYKIARAWVIKVRKVQKFEGAKVMADGVAMAVRMP